MRPEADHEERSQEHHRVREVGDDDPGRKDQLDGDRAQQDLHHQQDVPRGVAGVPSAGSLRCRRSATHGNREHESAHQRRGPAVTALDQRREVERREPLAVAAGPVVAAAHAGPRDPDDAAEDDQPDGEAAAGPGQTPEQSRPVRRVGSSQRKRRLHRVRPERTGRGRPLSRLYLAMPSPPQPTPGASDFPGTSGSGARSRSWSAPPSAAASSGSPRAWPGGSRSPGLSCSPGSSAASIALFGALTLAELAAALPRSGGVFAYLLEGFGPLPAFLFGWSELTVIRASALGAISTIFAEYLGYFLGFTPSQVQYVAAVADRGGGPAQLPRREERRRGS